MPEPFFMDFLGAFDYGVVVIAAYAFSRSAKTAFASKGR
jgi:hypothetical protein